MKRNKMKINKVFQMELKLFKRSGYVSYLKVM